MEGQEIGSVISEWMLQKQKDANRQVRDFAYGKYREAHPAQDGEARRQEELFARRADAWARNGQAFEEFAGSFQEIPAAEPWQGAQMLDNVIVELEMDREEQYRFLANVKMLIYDRATQLLDERAGGELRDVLEQNYEKEWEAAQKGIGENELQAMFAETVSLMGYAGIGYTDETRAILAKTGAGREARFASVAGEMKKDLQFLASFLVTEMALRKSDGQFTPKEEEIIARQMAPVCVSCVSMAEEGGDVGLIMKKAQLYFGRLLAKEEGNLRAGKLFAELAVVFVAAKAVFFLLKLAVAGVTIKIGMDSLWAYCREKLALDTEEINGFARILQGFAGKKQKQGKHGREWSQEPERETDRERETEWEDVK